MGPMTTAPGLLGKLKSLLSKFFGVTASGGTLQACAGTYKLCNAAGDGTITATVDNTGAGTLSVTCYQINVAATTYISATGFQTAGGENRFETGTGVRLGSGYLVGWSSAAQAYLATNDTNIGRAAAGVVGVYGANVSTPGWLQNTAGRTRLSADVTNATTAFSNLTGLSQTLIAGRKYSGILRVLCSDSTAAEGIKFDFNGGSATMTSFAAGVVGNVQGATAGTTVSAAPATAINFTAMNGTGTHYIDIAVSMVVNAAGTLIPRVAQNSHSTGTATAALGTYLWLEDTP